MLLSFQKLLPQPYQNLMLLRPLRRRQPTLLLLLQLRRRHSVISTAVCADILGTCGGGAWLGNLVGFLEWARVLEEGGLLDGGCGGVVVGGGVVVVRIFGDGFEDLPLHPCSLKVLATSFQILLNILSDCLNIIFLLLLVAAETTRRQVHS